VALRAAFGAERKLIRTVSRRGYQFIGEIRVPSGSPDECAAAAVVPAVVPPPTNRPQPVSELVGPGDDLGDILSLGTVHQVIRSG
jgi:DNA-binding winged helix-turn-helix (wHTH) protein